MYREKITELEKWKASTKRKPLIIRGARQVGKSWLVNHFGTTHYKKYVEINFDDDPILQNIFAADFDIPRIIGAIQAVKGTVIDSDTLLFFDEIQAAPRGLMSLKYFYEKAPQYQIIAAGSLLGLDLHPGDSFPVGKVDFMDLPPLNFREFLMAMGENGLADLLKSADIRKPDTWVNINILHPKYLEYLKMYYYIGGMPEVVNDFVDNHRDWIAARETQLKIIKAYRADFSKHVPKELVQRTNMVWNGIPAQLSKENKRFVYGILREGARASQFEVAIEWLINCGLLLKSVKISKPSLPLIAYEQMNTFKLYLLDVGLLSALSELDAKTIVDGNAVYTEFKGALTEQFVCQELYQANSNSHIRYWANDNSTAEVDFIIQHDGEIIPIEAKASINLSARSFSNFCVKYKSNYAIKTSELPYKANTPIFNVPLYAISNVFIH